MVGWLVVLGINVDLAIFQPYLDLEAGDNQSLKIQVARPGIDTLYNSDITIPCSGITKSFKRYIIRTKQYCDITYIMMIQRLDFTTMLYNEAISFYLKSKYPSEISFYVTFISRISVRGFFTRTHARESKYIYPQEAENYVNSKIRDFLQCETNTYIIKTLSHNKRMSIF